MDCLVASKYDTSNNLWDLGELFVTITLYVEETSASDLGHRSPV